MPGEHRHKIVRGDAGEAGEAERLGERCDEGQHRRDIGRAKHAYVGGLADANRHRAGRH